MVRSNLKRAICWLLLSASISAGAVIHLPGITVDGANNSSPAEIDMLTTNTATPKAFGPPRMSTTTRGNFTGLTEGLVIYNNTVHFLEHYDGAAWHDVCTTDGTQTLTNKTISGASNTLSNIPLSSGVTGVLPIANGGTGQSSAVATPAASSYAVWDANKNLQANNMIQGYTTTATAGGTTTLVVGSSEQQYFTGSANQTVKLPQTSTLVIGTMYKIVNQSTGTVTVQTFASNTIQAIAPASFLVVTSISTSVDTTAGWFAQYTTTGGALTNPMTTSGDTLYGGTAGAATRLAAGVAGQMLTTNGAGNPPLWLNQNALDIRNVGLKAAASGGALTITLTQADGSSAPTGSAPVFVSFKTNTGIAAGTNVFSQTSGISITIPNGATIGESTAPGGSGQDYWTWVYGLLDSGVMDICVSGINVFSDALANQATQITGGANLGTILYCTNAHSGFFPTRILGRFMTAFATNGVWGNPVNAEILPIPQRNTTEWVSNTCGQSAGFGTVLNNICWSRRVGANLEMYGGWTNGTVAASAATVQLSFNGSTCNVNSSSSLANAQSNLIYGFYGSSTAAGGSAYVRHQDQGINCTVGFGSGTGSAGASYSNGSAVSNTGNLFSFWFSVPIQGWSEFGP